MWEEGSAPWDSKGPRLVPVGGIGINRVETSYPIMTRDGNRNSIIVKSAHFKALALLALSLSARGFPRFSYDSAK